MVRSSIKATLDEIEERQRSIAEAERSLHEMMMASLRTIAESKELIARAERQLQGR